MPLILLLGLIFPRVVIFILWLLTDWFARVPVDLIVGVLGFLFLPFTLLWYSVVMNIYGGSWGMWQMLILLIAVCTDLFHLFASSRYYYAD